PTADAESGEGLSEGQRASEGEAVDADDAQDNPFIRPAREKERPARRSRARASEEARPADAEEGATPAPKRASRSRAKTEESASLDPGLLPPSIPRDEEAAPRPRTRRRARPTDAGEDEALEATG